MAEQATGALVDRRPRVVLLAEERLVGDALRTALSNRRLDVVAMGWPEDHRTTAFVRRAVAAVRPTAGILLGELDDPLHRAQARMLVATLPMHWVLVVRHDQDIAWGDLVAAGATLLPTSISLEDLSEGVTRLMSGGHLMAPETRHRLVREWRDLRDEMNRMTERLSRLSPRETEVLEHLAAGLTVRDIAVVGEVAEGTVRTQVKAVLRKLEVNSQIAAVALARTAEAHGAVRRIDRSDRIKRIEQSERRDRRDRNGP